LGSQAGSPDAEASVRQQILHHAVMTLPSIGEPGRRVLRPERPRISPVAPGTFAPALAPSGLFGRKSSGGAGHG
jgi:hypothetical protein